MIIRRCGINDIQEIAKIGSETFRDTYMQTAGLTNEEFDNYLSSIYQTDVLTKELNDPKTAYYFSESPGDELTGFMKINLGTGPVELENQNGFEIERIYLREKFTGKGIGQALLNHAVTIAKSGNADYIWLKVWDRNQGAIRFYQKNGFVEIGEHPYQVDKASRTIYHMMLEL